METTKPQLQVNKSGGNLTIEWEARPEVYYFMEGAPDLTAGTPWVTAKLLKDNDTSGSLTLGTAVSGSKAFYRLNLEGDPDSARLREDADGDGIINLLEVEAGWDAYVAEDATDSDSDGIPDYFEQFHFGTLEHDASYVAVAGGLTLGEAFANATDPNSADSDGDGFSDAQEISWGWNPNYDQSRDDLKYGLEGDLDGDGLTNTQEAEIGTDPGNPNTDGDPENMNDSEDAWPLDENLNMAHASESYVLIDLSAYIGGGGSTLQIDDFGGILSSSIVDGASSLTTANSATISYLDLSTGTVYGDAELGLDYNMEALDPDYAYILYRPFVPFLTRSGVLVFNSYVETYHDYDSGPAGGTPSDNNASISSNFTSDFRSSHDLRDATGGFPSSEIASAGDIVAYFASHPFIWSSNSYTTFGFEYSNNPHPVIEGYVDEYDGLSTWDITRYSKTKDSGNFVIYDSVSDSDYPLFSAMQELPPAVDTQRANLIATLFEGVTYWDTTNSVESTLILDRNGTYGRVSTETIYFSIESYTEYPDTLNATTKTSDQPVIIETTAPAYTSEGFVVPNVYINGRKKPVTDLLGSSLDNWDQIRLHDINSQGVIVGTGKFQQTNEQGEPEGSPVKKAFLLLKMDLAGHLPGPNGQRISEANEDDPDKLVVPVNDNFDERYRITSGTVSRLHPDCDNSAIDLSKDQDYIRLNLQFSEGINEGTLQLVFKGDNGFETEALLEDGLYFYSEDGQNALVDAGNLTVDLSNISSTDPLFGINTAEGVTILAEGHASAEDYTLALKYSNGSTTVYDELHLHVVDIDFADTPDDGALDDDDEGSSVPHRWAMMVPLFGEDDSPGSGKVEITVSPSSLASKVQIDWASGANPPSSFGPHTLTSAVEHLTIDANSRAIGNALEVKWTPTGQVIDGLNVDFMPRRAKNPGIYIQVALWEITDQGGTTPLQPYNKQAILNFLEDSWTDGANVHFKIIQDWKPKTVDYDINNSDSLDAIDFWIELDEFAEFRRIKDAFSNSNAQIDIYLVRDMPGYIGAALENTKAVFIAENSAAGSTPLSGLAQEVGHVLGINEEGLEGDDVLDTGNVMSDPQEFGSTQIRKVDWRNVEE